MSKSGKLRRLRPSPALIVGVVALVFAVSGVAVALPGKNSVASKDIKKGAVTAAKIKDGAVTTAKLANNAATGAKIDEATLGKVPSAGTADTAAKATSAETAAKAGEAAKAADSAELEGRTLAQVRPVSVGLKDETPQGLDALSYETVMTIAINVSAGGGNVVLNAAVELNNGAAGQAGGACRLKFNGSVVSSAVNVTMPAGHSEAIGLTAIDSASAGARVAAVECVGSLSDDDVDFTNGDLTVIALPTGS